MHRNQAWVRAVGMLLVVAGCGQGGPSVDGGQDAGKAFPWLSCLSASSSVDGGSTVYDLKFLMEIDTTCTAGWYFTEFAGTSAGAVAGPFFAGPIQSQPAPDGGVLRTGPCQTGHAFPDISQFELGNVRGPPYVPAGVAFDGFVANVFNVESGVAVGPGGLISDGGFSAVYEFTASTALNGTPCY